MQVLCYNIQGLLLFFFQDDLEMVVKFKTTVETRNDEEYLKINKILLQINCKRLGHKNSIFFFFK